MNDKLFLFGDAWIKPSSVIMVRPQYCTYSEVTGRYAVTAYLVSGEIKSYGEMIYDEAVADCARIASFINTCTS